MKNCLLVLVIVGFGSSFLYAQPDHDTPSAPLTFEAKGTGRTTGHIADLTITNKNDFKVEVNFGPYFIPSSGQFQPYIVPAIPNTNVPPNGTVTIPVEGYCTDIHQAPVPSGVSLPGMNEWVRIGNPITETPPNIVIPATRVAPPLPENWKPTLIEGWKPLERGKEMKLEISGVDEKIPIRIRNLTPNIIELTEPGKDTPLGHTLNPQTDPQVAAPFLFEGYKRIELKVIELQNQGAIQTPFSSQPEKERESIIQQTFWIFTAALEGKPYSIIDFTHKTVEQYENTTHKEFVNLPEEQQDQLAEGIEQFWGTFEAVGVQAKVIDSGTTTVFQQMPDGNNPRRQRSPECKCDSLQVTVTLMDGNNAIETKTASGTFLSSALDLELTTNAVQSKKKYTIKVADITVFCHCDGADADCPFYPTKSTGGPDLAKPGQVKIETGENDADASNDNWNGVITNAAKDRWNEDGTEYTMEVEFAKHEGNTSNPYQCFTISSWCKGDGCRQDLCKRKVCVKFKW